MTTPNEYRRHDASTSGLPTRAALTLTENAIVAASATVDLAIRTIAASLVAGTLAPTLGRRSTVDRELDSASFYADIARQKDVSVAFPGPTESPEVMRRRVGRIARALSVGTAETIRYRSSFEPLNPAMKPVWDAQTRNNTACAQHWRHGDRPRPTLIVLHGFFASPHVLNSAFLQLPWFYRAGFDVVLFTLPFHGSRAEPRSPYSGYGYFANGWSGFVEATGQAIHDLRVLIDGLKEAGVEKIGVTGISLGGFTSALLAAVEPRLDVSIPNVPVVSVPDLLDSWFPASLVVRAGCD